MNTTPKGDGPKEGLKRRIVLLTALVATLMIPVVLFFGYDLLRARLLPCATTAERVGVELTTKIKLAGIEGEVHLGKENLWELSERAQLLALDLKSCCQLLSGGRDNTSAFLQCKASARRYETDIENVISHVRAAVAAETAQLTDKLSEATRGIAEAVTAARTTSETFSGRVREIRKEQAIVQLEALPPQHVEVEAQEREPNDDVLTTNVVKLGAWITGAIGHPRDDDFYTFTLPDGPRDVFSVDLENRSTTLEPELHH